MLRYYLSAIGIATVLVAALNAVFASTLGFTPWQAILLTVAFVLLAFLLDAIVACLSRVLPKKLFAPERKRFAVSDKEKRFYDRLKIKSWKDKIPETGALLKIFDKTKIENSDDPVYLRTFLRETCYAEIMHEYSAPLAFFLLFAAPGPLKWTIALPVAVVNFVLQLFPIAVQRYNRNRLTKLYRVRLKKAERAEKTATSPLPGAPVQADAPVQTDAPAKKEQSNEKPV